MYNSTYLILIIFIALVVIGGYESTLRLIRFIDISIRFEIVKFKMFLMRRKLEQQLIKDLPNFNKLTKELKDDQR